MGGTGCRPEPSATREPGEPQRRYRTRPGETALAVRPVASVGGHHPRVTLFNPEEAPRADPHAGCCGSRGIETPGDPIRAEFSRKVDKTRY